MLLHVQRQQEVADDGEALGEKALLGDPRSDEAAGRDGPAQLLEVPAGEHGLAKRSAVMNVAVHHATGAKLSSAAVPVGTQTAHAVRSDA